MTQGGKHSKTGNEGEHGVRDTDDGRVHDRRFGARAVTPEGRQNTERESDRKEDLGHRHAPHFSLGPEHAHIPDPNVFRDTIGGTLERRGLDEKDKEEDHRNSHGGEGDTSGPFNTPRDGEKDDHPGHEGKANVSGDHSRWVAGLGNCGAADDDIEKVIAGFLARQIFISPGRIIVP